MYKRVSGVLMSVIVYRNEIKAKPHFVEVYTSNMQICNTGIHIPIYLDRF